MHWTRYKRYWYQKITILKRACSTVRTTWRSWTASVWKGRPPANSIIQSRYNDMLLEQENVPWFHNILASGFAWILLAGYLVFPGTFTSLRDSEALQAMASQNKVGSAVYYSVQNMPLLGLAATCCIVGGTGSIWLWWQWRTNYLWPTQHLFM
ncbi:hypothetical protein ASPWEDRAFT_122515 [Aspergillus wentii DTO 134E9]|uniref:Uncharacterized protein n=1 Tax=Aspergillus wentii DTO 134E9 TaxID=1073089 RepID=A0A1L9R3Q3_ASPWE|nr:uncharacterized protein ASPWEDRAFT_122515 [Aspergillus wentii DTO 134E9]OJJ29548.1 hypothetical protein ASPWEDRAFT_122515 [Aspergillus wentii DTO 134E9]